MDEKKTHPVLKAVGIIVLVLLVVTAVCAFLFYRSAMTLKADGQDILNDVDDMIAQVSEGDSSYDFEADITDIANRVDAIDAELNNWLWSTAARLPILGEDVQIAQTLVDVADDLVDQAVLPILQELDYLSSYELITDIIQGEKTLDNLVVLIDELENSITVIDEADETVDALGQAHFKELQEIVDQAKSIMDQITEVADEVEIALEVIDLFFAS